MQRSHASAATAWSAIEGERHHPGVVHEHVDRPEGLDREAADAAMSARSVTSVTRPTASAPVATIPSTVSRSPTSSTSAATTFAPLAAVISAMSRPKPLAGPGDDDDLALHVVDHPPNVPATPDDQSSTTPLTTR